jgi:F-type H+-transporting ATPase subunit b
MQHALLRVLAATETEPVKNPLIPEIYDIVWSIVPFAIVLFFFWRVILPRMQETLDARAEKIEGGIAQAESAQKEAAEALEKYNVLLAEARTEASEIKDKARGEGAIILAELKDQASADAAAIVAKAHQQIEAERLAAIQSLRSEVGQLALDLAGRVIGDQVKDSKASSAIVDRFLADIEKNEKRK